MVVFLYAPLNYKIENMSKGKECSKENNAHKGKQKTCQYGQRHANLRKIMLKSRYVYREGKAWRNILITKDEIKCRYTYSKV